MAKNQKNQNVIAIALTKAKATSGQQFKLTHAQAVSLRKAAGLGADDADIGRRKGRTIELTVEGLPGPLVLGDTHCVWVSHQPDEVATVLAAAHGKLALGESVTLKVTSAKAIGWDGDGGDAPTGKSLEDLLG